MRFITVLAALFAALLTCTSVQAQTVVTHDRNGDTVAMLLGPIVTVSGQQWLRYWDTAEQLFWRVMAQSGEFYPQQAPLLFETPDCTGQRYVEFSAEGQAILATDTDNVFKTWAPRAPYSPLLCYAWMGWCAEYICPMHLQVAEQVAFPASLSANAPYYQALD